MKLFFYYAFCSVKNQLRKLFKTWVMVFFAVCFAFGILIGIGAGVLGDLASDYTEDETYEGETGEVEQMPDGEIPEDEIVDEWTDEDAAFLMSAIELGAGAVILLIFVYNAFASDKNGCAIFQPADVNLLFASPMKPQSVLLFRLMTQIATSLALSIYLLFQLPNLVMNLGISVWACLGVLAAWILILILSSLLRVLLYTVGSTYPHIKAYIRPMTVGLICAIAGSFVLYWQLSGQEPFSAAVSFFNAPVTRWIPIWGWIKGACMFAIEENALGAILSIVGTAAAVVGLVFWIWSIPADFYEDAMAKSQETADLQAAQAEGQMMRRKKDRSERLERDGLRHGFGANVYFFKSMYNRFRFAHFRIFTKTSETYLLVGVGGSLLLRFVLEVNSIVPVALALAGFAFFRSLGNPLAQDTGMDSFITVPASPWAKVLWSMLGGTLNCVLDLIPGLLAATIILGVNPLLTLAWLLFIVSLDLYSTCAGMFIDFSVPSSTAKQIKAVIQIMFIYFGLLPDIGLLIVGGILGFFPLFAGIAACFNVAVAGIFFAFAPMFLLYGRK